MGYVVVVNGFHRTGSTKCFYTAQRILAELDIPFKSLGANLTTVDDAIDHHLSQGGAEWLTIKTHRWMPTRSNDAVIPFYTTRNLADVARSYLYHRARRGVAAPSDTANLFVTQDVIWQIFFNRYCISSFPVIEIRYEEFYERDALFTAKLAKHMGLELSEKAISRVAEQIAVERVKRETDALDSDADPVSQYRKFHISDGLGRPNGSIDGLPSTLQSTLEKLGAFESPEQR